MLLKVFKIIVLFGLFLISSFKLYSVECNVERLNQNYNHDKENFAKLFHIYSKYLSKKTNIPGCDQDRSYSYDLSNCLSVVDCKKADHQIQGFIANDEKYLDGHPRGRNFSQHIYQAGLSAIRNEFVAENIATCNCLSEFEIVVNLAKRKPPHCVRSEFCDIDSDVSPIVECDPNSKYSRIDGKCNNLVHTNWGSGYHCQCRLLPPDYKDGISEPRVAFDGSDLPNPRLITNEYMPVIDHISMDLTSLHMIWGQFIAHDTYKTLQYWSSSINCCTEPPVHRECFSMKDIPRDKYSIAFNQTCLNFVRSISCHTCSLGPREQINAATSLLDLSHIHGGNQKNQDSLRTFKNGELETGLALDGSILLPKAIPSIDQDHVDFSPCKGPSEKPWLTCFKTGDGIRGNQNPMSAALNLIFVERHNQHCRGLAQVNPHWNDEKLYQEARKMLIAEYQHIVFNEYVPTLFNEHQLDYYGLRVKQKGCTRYNPNVNPCSINCVGVAAFRFGHSQITSVFKVKKEHYLQTYTFKLRDKFFEMSDLWEGNGNGILEGMCQMHSYKIDRFINEDVHNFGLFNKLKPRIGDLPSLNINRGRDHGIPGYVYFLEYCTGAQIQCWDDLVEFIPMDNMEKLKRIYKDHRDIDLFVGGLSEINVKGSLLGPTFGTLMAIQFNHWKYGDRFYFEHSGESGSFTKEQLDNIRDVASMSNILCKTTDITRVQRNCFLLPSKHNELRNCEKMNEIDYSRWREFSPCRNN